jgi:hypothetical protein
MGRGGPLWFGEVNLSVPKVLLDRYLKGLPVDPKSLFYGGSPE